MKEKNIIQNKQKNFKRGFTLLELLVVVLIISILAAIAIPGYKISIAKARLAGIKPLLLAFKNAEEMFYAEHGNYLYDFTNLKLDVEHNCTAIFQYDTIFRCNDSYFVIDVMRHISFYEPYNYHRALYCPGYNDSWDNCWEHYDFEYRVWMAQSSKPNQTECIGNTDFGKKVCESIE